MVKHNRMGQKVIQAIMVFIIFIIIFSLYKILWDGKHDQRGRISFTSVLMRELNVVLNQYKISNNAYPPINPNTDSYYGILDYRSYERYREQIRIHYSAVPPLDPNRDKRIYDNDIYQKSYPARYHEWMGSRDFYYGYEFRYYRSVDGKYAIIMSNGPDMDVDITKSMLDSSDRMSQINMNTYDPTNGTYSEGDVVRILK